MDISQLINQMIVLMLILCVGILCGKIGLIDDLMRERLSKLVLYVVQCALIISSAINTETDLKLSVVLTVLAMSAAMHVILIALGQLFARLVRAKPADRGTYAFMTSFGNILFMGFPVLKVLYGDIAVLYGAIFAMPFNFIVFSVGVMMLSGGSEKAKFDVKKAITAPFIACIVAMLLMVFKINLPEPVATAFSTLGSVTVPCAMLIIGASLSTMSLKEVFGQPRMYILAPVKLVLCPIIIWALFGLVIKDPVLLGLVTIMAGMPVAVNATMFCIQFNGNEKLASSGVFLTTILSAVSIPFVSYLLLI